MSESLDDHRSWLKAVVHASRLAELSDAPAIDLSGCRPSRTPLEELIVRGLRAEHELRRQKRAAAPLNGTVARLLRVIAETSRIPDCSPQLVAATLGVSTSTASRLCRRATGDSIMERVHRVRVERAVQLLADSTLSVKEIAFEVGYARTSALDRQFSRLLGIQPTALRRNDGK